MLQIAFAALTKRLAEVGPDLRLEIRSNVAKGIHDRIDLIQHIGMICCHTKQGDTTTLAYVESSSEQAMMNALFTMVEQIDAEAPQHSRIRKHVEIVRVTKVEEPIESELVSDD